MRVIRLEDWKAAGRSFRHRGHAVFYREEGAGDALMLLHGFPTASWDWHRLWPELRARYRVIAHDMLGYGFSDKPREYDYSLMDQADICEELLGALGVARVHILAHDVGDSVAQELLARKRGTIASVCLLNGGLFPETHRATLTQKLLASPIGVLVARLMNEKKFARAFSRVFTVKPSEEELAAFWKLVAYNDGVRIAHKLIGYIAERRRHRERWVGALHTTVPLRVINGADDPVSGAHMIARLREEIPNADVVMLDGVGHYPQVEDPAAVLRAYFEFRDRLVPPTPAV